jgi:hypothetical protein
MPRVIKRAAAAAVAAFLTAAAANAAEQKLPTLRVTRDDASVHTRPALLSDVVAKPAEGTILEAIDLEDGWYWVVLPADEQGRRLPGWVRERDVEIAAAGDPDSVLRHFSEAVAQAKARKEAEAAAQEARLEQARQRLEDARREYETATKKAPGGPAAPDPASAVKAAPAEAAHSTPARLSRAKAPRAAASREYEWFGGYSFYRDQSDSLSFPGGWAFSVARQMTPAIDLVGGISGSHKSENVLGVNLASTTLYTFAAGPKYSRHTGSVTSFGQVLVGIATMHATAFGVSDSSTGFALQPGMGIDIPIARTLNARVGFDIESVHGTGGWFTGFRINTGLMLVTGTR